MDRQLTRRLATVVMADVVGYSRQMEQDQSGTIERLRSMRKEVVGPLTRRFGGRVVDTAGDSWLAEFSSVTDAVQSSLAIQNAMGARNRGLPPDERFEVRIGIDLGEIVCENDAIFGTGINVAARLQALAEPGGICISGSVHDQLQGLPAIDCEDLGEQQVKNIARPIHCYAIHAGVKAAGPEQRHVVRGAGEGISTGRSRFRYMPAVALVVLLGVALYVGDWNPDDASTREPAAPAYAARQAAGGIAEDHSVAVLPFENRSRFEDDVFFVDGIHNDVLTQLSKVGALTVIARTSVERFRGTDLPIRVIAEQLGVTAVVEGGVQRAGDRVHISVQLIDAVTEGHLWAATYDRELTAANIFAIQTEIASAIATSLRAALGPGDQERMARRTTEQLEAWEAYQLGRQQLSRRTSESLAEAESFFRRAIEIDPGFALAHVGAVESLIPRIGQTGFPPEQTLARAETDISAALSAQPSLAEAVAAAASIALLRGDYAAAEAGFRRSIELSPSSAAAYLGCSRLYGLTGNNGESLECAQQAALLDPLSVITIVNFGRALERVGRFGEALDRYRKAIEIDPAVPASYLLMGSVYAHGFGRLDEAIPWFQQAARLDPGNPAYALAMAGSYIDLGLIDEARRWLDQAAERGAEYQDVATVEGLLLIYQGRTEETVRVANRVLEVDPRNRHALNLLRIAAVSMYPQDDVLKRYERAYAELVATEGPRIDGSNFGAAIDFADVLLQSGEVARAQEILDASEWVVKAGQRMGWQGYGLADAQIHALRGNPEKALVSLREAEIAGWRSFAWRYFRDFDPNLKSLRGEPEFNAVFADIERDMARQRAALSNRSAKDASAAIRPPM